MRTEHPDTTEKADRKEAHPKAIEIHVNNKAVVVDDNRLTGREIKEAAIAQGVEIGLDFELAEELPHGRERIVGDDDVVSVTRKSRFIATAPDDNS